MLLRPVTDSDLHALDQLNRAAVPNVNDVGEEGLKHLAAQAAFFRLAKDETGPLGFLVAMTPEADYASPNFLWFKERYPGFCYIDRVVVAENARRLGVGSSLYRAVIDFSTGRAPVLACEVNLRPANPGSLAFHERFGFRQVGTQDTENGKKTVSLMLRQL
ncbi:GNAT family N-acetyltransferase [Desulfovibrio aminophilus]|uniref:GNAT family N-acetyltransferase n=1 Tax=Desulfovibrio aminophilus TaxID=81425 RepID=UPI0033941185